MVVEWNLVFPGVAEQLGSAADQKERFSVEIFEMCSTAATAATHHVFLSFQ